MLEGLVMAAVSTRTEHDSYLSKPDDRTPGFGSDPLPHGQRSIAVVQEGSSVSTEAGSICRTLFACLDTFNETELETYLRVVVLENFGLRDMMKYGMIVKGHSIEPDLFHRAKNLPADAWMRAVRSEVGNVNVGEIILAGATLLARLTVSTETPSHPEIAWRYHHSEPACIPLPDVHMNNISISSVSFVAAIAENARHLRIPSCDIVNQQSQSPFCILGPFPIEYTRFGYSQPTNVLGSQHSTDGGNHLHPYEHLQPDLRPTPIQRNIPHHPCLDILPWPEFRSKAIMAASMDPPHIDEDDLCLDLLNDGIRCWASNTKHAYGRGQGMPWDSRSWEAAPWFLQKWESLTDGKDGDMWRNSRWWQSMRTLEQ
jgi:hypothetical protein